MDVSAVELSDDSCGWPQNSDSLAEISTVSDHNASSPVTPKSDTVPLAINFGHGSSDVSRNHDSDSSYPEFDSEAEAFYSSLNHHLVSPWAMDSHDLAAAKQISYSKLMKKYVQCEEELRNTSLKLQESEQEIEKLKGETETRESAVLLAENLRAELETAQREIETRDIAIETEKSRGLELQRQVVDLENKLSDSNFKFENVVNELRGMLWSCQKSFSTETIKLQTDIAGLEGQIRHSEAENMKKQRKEVELQDEINALKTDLALRDALIEALNQDFDKHKLRFNMLMEEKDEVSAEVDNLKAEMRSSDIQTEQMEEQLEQLLYKQTELVFELRNAKNTVEELRATVKELEKQTELQRNAISEGEEDKREAIKQLCFSLDHYKSGYRELLRFCFRQ